MSIFLKILAYFLCFSY